AGEAARIAQLAQLRHGVDEDFLHQFLRLVRVAQPGQGQRVNRRLKTLHQLTVRRAVAVSGPLHYLRQFVPNHDQSTYPDPFQGPTAPFPKHRIRQGSAVGGRSASTVTATACDAGSWFPRDGSDGFRTLLGDPYGEGHSARACETAVTF